MTSASWTGQTCSGALLSNETLLTLNTCANGSLSTCGATASPPAPAGGSPSNTGVIIGAAVGGAAAVVVGAALAVVGARRYGYFSPRGRAAVGGPDERAKLVAV